MDTMTPQHPQWDEFIRRLDGPEGVNRQGAGETMTGNCGNYLSRAKAILESTEGVDVEASLRFFNDNGAACDCEILFNIAATN